MSFIRPEVREQMWRWREALVGAGVMLFGLWAAVAGRGVMSGIGALLMIAGIALVFAGWQRGRFRQGHEGAGLVDVTEGQIAYWGPFSGGVLAVASISRVVLNPLPRSGPVWELHAPGQDPLRMPVNAEGAEALFDVFGALPDFDTEAMLAALQAPGPVPRIVWTRSLRLH